MFILVAVDVVLYLSTFTVRQWYKGSPRAKRDSTL
jgi:hypothetical protein